MRKIGIYRTAFPLASETFIREQAQALRAYEAQMICRDLVAEAKEFEPVVSIRGRNSRVNRLGFTLLGACGGFSEPGLLGRLALLHAHFAPDAVMAMSLAKKLRIPLVVTCHGSDVTVSDQALVRDGKVSGLRYLLQRSALRSYASRFLAVSDFLRRTMLDRGFPAEKVVRHYVGVDTRKFVPMLQGQSPVSDSPYILSVARHSEVKGVDLLLKGFARVAARNPELRLVQIGNGTLTGSLRQLASDLGIGDRVDFLGAQPSQEVLRYVQQARALVLSSRKAASGAEESFGLVLLEAAACHVPVIGTRVGGIPEALIDGETGFLVNPEDDADLAQKLSVLLENKDLALAMGIRGGEFVRDVFDLHKQTRKLESLYSEVMA